MDINGGERDGFEGALPLEMKHFDILGRDAVERVPEVEPEFGVVNERPFTSSEDNRVACEVTWDGLGNGGDDLCASCLFNDLEDGWARQDAASRGIQGDSVRGAGPRRGARQNQDRCRSQRRDMFC